MKKIIFTEKAPAPIGPYNQAVLIKDTLYTSGQIALHPETMELILDDIETETKQVMENMKAVRHLADKYGKLLIMDAARFAENAYFIKTREEACSGMSIREIVNVYKRCSARWLIPPPAGVPNIVT